MKRVAFSISVGLIGVTIATCVMRSNTTVAAPDNSIGRARSARSDSAIAPSEEPTEFRFTVVEGRTGKPIADAEVRWIPEDQVNSDTFYEEGPLFGWLKRTSRDVVMNDFGWPSVEVDPQGQVELFAPSAGRYSLRWVMQRTGSADAPTRTWQDPPQYDDVKDTSEPQHFDMQCPIDPATAWKQG